MARHLLSLVCSICAAGCTFTRVSYEYEFLGSVTDPERTSRKPPARLIVGLSPLAPEALAGCSSGTPTVVDAAGQFSSTYSRELGTVLMPCLFPLLPAAAPPVERVFLYCCDGSDWREVPFPIETASQRNRTHYDLEIRLPGVILPAECRQTRPTSLPPELVR